MHLKTVECKEHNYSIFFYPSTHGQRSVDKQCLQHIHSYIALMLSYVDIVVSLTALCNTMASLGPRLTDPDKLGILIQCRMKMDKLNSDQLYNYAHLALKSLSMEQLKKLLFVGFNSIRNDIEYNQLFNMKTALNEIIENAKKLKEIKSKSKQKQKTKPKATIPIIPKNASLTKTIPFDIISNNICPFLKMSSITNAARCDRQLAVICHSPTSIKNLMHRYDPYKYAEMAGRDVEIDGHYTNMESWTVSNIHRFKNVEKLSIKLSILNRLDLFNVFQKVKHLTFYIDPRDEYPYIGYMEQMKLMPLLQTISFVEFNDVWTLLHFLSPIKTAHFNKIIHQLTSIAFVDSVCGLHPDEYDEPYEKYQNIANFILPSQPNRLQVLKFENSCFGKTIDPKCADINNEFANIERIKTSLSNLNGFVYAQSTEEFASNNNLYFTLTTNILSNLILFSKLESIHTHSSTHDLIALYLNFTNVTASRQISELCISVGLESLNQNPSPFNTRSLTPFNRRRFVPHLEKLCLVIKISDNDKAFLPNFEKIIRSILRDLAKLKVLQIVAIIEDETGSDASFCTKKINILSELSKVLVNAFLWVRKHSISKSNVKQQLLFKFHVKLSHLQRNANCKTNNITALKLRAFVESIQSMIINYLITYQVGKIQFKLSWNTSEHVWLARELKRFLFGLDALFRVYVKECGCLIEENKYYHLNDMDYKQYAVSATKQKTKKNVDHEKNWKVDCRYCCNTPWV